ncbi:MAG: hypothetical protein NVS2B12_11350 [Ktedonobacteraceae bacterium]
MSTYHTSGQRAAWLEDAKQWIGKILVPDALEIYADLDWEDAAQTFQQPTVEYPSYYLVPHHGVEAGYLSNWQSFSWELIENIFGIRRVRPALLHMAQATNPSRIVDLGCGTALTSIALTQRLPEAQLTLLDLSPYQLAAAGCQVQHAGLSERTRLMRARAEETGLPDASADLALATLLFHELPHTQARAVIQEARRLLVPGGRFVVFDAIQQVVPWPGLDRAINTVLAVLMREVYWREYMSQPIWQVCTEEGFTHVERKLLFALPWIYQVVTATR